FESDYVAVDLELGGYMATHYLIQLGHRKIGLIYGVANPDLGKERLEGYKRALLESGIPFNEQQVKGCGYKIDDGYRATQEILSGDEIPTALFTINDLIAIGALRAVKEKSFNVPHDISIIGFDDIVFSSYTDPPLTTVSIRKYEMGLAAAKMLIGQIEGLDAEYDGGPILLKPELLIRGSCAGYGMES
ncbi:MAG: substrate-binding domain-containing protein, partial [Spirochaetota bacterium]